MNAKHTPGPWVFAYGSVYREDTLHDESSIRIALMDREEPHTTPVERDANARLIAAAPELLEALRLMLDADSAISEDRGLKSDQAMLRIAAVDAASAAITKATGGTL